MTRCHLLEFLLYERRDVVEIIDAVRDQLFLDRQQQIFLQHALDDVLRRTEHVIILVTYLDLRQRGLVDVEGLIDELYFLTRLLEVPLLEVLFNIFVDVVSPVEHFQLVCAVNTAAGTQHDSGNSQY